jgi:hypothetical protein
MLLVSLWPFSLFLVAPYAAGYFMALFFILCSSLCCWLVYGPFLSFSYWLKYPTFECSFKVFDNVWMEINLPSYKNTKQPPVFPINYLLVTLIHKLLPTRTENMDWQILNKWSIFLCGHVSFLPTVTIEYKCFPQHAGFDLSSTSTYTRMKLKKSGIPKKKISIKVTIFFTVYLYFAVGFFWIRLKSSTAIFYYNLVRMLVFHGKAIYSYILW